MSEEGGTMNVKLDQQLRWCLEMFEILQESNRSGVPVNGSAGGTHDDPSDMTQPPETQHNERCVDWSPPDDDDSDDVTARRNAVNERDRRQTKKESQPPSERKSSFSLFGGRQERKSKDEETSVGAPLRRPKRFFSQQNLRAVSRDESVFEVPVGPSTPRFAPPKFLARLLSHQKFRSNQDLPSVHEGFRTHDQRRDSNSRPKTSVSSSSSRATTLGISSLTDVRLGPEGMEGDGCFVTDASARDAGYPCFVEAARRDGGVHARASCPSWSGWQEEEEEEEENQIREPSHVSRLRQNVVMGHDLSPNGRFLGEYRPRLNTHQEEPTGAGASVEDAHPRDAGLRSTNRWSLQAPESIRDPTSLYGTPQEPRHAFEGYPQEQVPGTPATTAFTGVSTLDIDNMARPSCEPNVDHRNTSNMDRLRDEPVLKNYQQADGVDLGSVELRHKQTLSSTSVLPPPQHFKSASYDNCVSDHKRNSDVRRGHAGDTLPSRFSPNQVQTLRQRSQEFYGEYPLAQRKAISNADICQSLWDQGRQTLGTDYRSAVAGRPRATDPNSPPSMAETFRAGVGMSQQGNDGSPLQLDSGHFRSFSMSQLQWNTNDLPQWTGRHQNGFRQSPSNAHQRASPNTTPFTWLQDNGGQDSIYLQQMASHHERGGSLDSSGLDSSSFDPTIIRPCVDPRRSSAMVEDQAYSDPEVVGNFRRRSYDPTERPLRYRFSNRHGSGASGGDEAISKRFQQQAVLSLFQKLMLAKQQKMYTTTNSSSSGTMGSWEPLSASDIQTPRARERPETKGWNDGIQANRNLLPQTLTDHNSRLSTEPERTMRSPMCVGCQPYPVTHERSSFHSYEDLMGDVGSMDPSHIDESITNRPQFRLASSRHHENGDKLPSKVKVSHSSTDLTNQRGASPVQTTSQLTTNCPLLIQLTSQGQMTNQGQMTSQGQNGTVQHRSPPPPLPPKSHRLHNNYSLDRDDGLAFDAEDIYAHQLRQEARKLSLSSGSLRTGSSSKWDSLGEATDFTRDLEGCDADVFHPSHHQHHQRQIQQQQGEHRVNEDGANVEPVMGGWLTDATSSARSVKPVEFSEMVSPSSCDQFLTLPRSRDRCAETEKTEVNSAGGICDKKEIVQSENGRVSCESKRVFSGSGRVSRGSGRVQNESGRVSRESGRVQYEIGLSQRVNYCIQSEPCETVSSDHDTSYHTNDAYPNHTGNASQPILPSTGDVTCSDQPISGRDIVHLTTLRTPDTTNWFPPQRNGSLVVPVRERSSFSSSEPAHSLKDFPDTDSSASAEDESFRGLASVLCRHLGSVDEELCSALRPPYVKASADFVRWVFENRKVLDLDLARRLEQPCRTARISNETPKDLKIPHYSLQTLKDELLTLVEKRLQRHLERRQRLSERQTETRQLEHKVTGIVREKTNSKQFEKFLSYLEQLEKVIQLLLNLSVRLSNVDKDLCHISEDTKDKQKKQLTDKRRQILERLKEAMELKWNIDERSQQVSAWLSDCLTTEEFNEYTDMVRSRCHVTLQSQAIEDRTEVVLMQKKILLVRCQPPQRQSPPPEIIQL